MTIFILITDLVLIILLAIFIKQSRFVSVKPKVWDPELDRLLEVDVDLTIKDEGATVYDKIKFVNN